MASAKDIAGLVGPTLVVLTTSEGLHLHLWETHLPQVTYLNGMLLFVAGLAIVRAHPRWMRGWPVVVTLTGWLTLLLGIYRVFAPEAPQASAGPVTYAGLAVLFAAGVLMTLMGYARSPRSSA